MACRSEVSANDQNWHLFLSDASPQGLETMNAGEPYGVRLFLCSYLSANNTLFFNIKDYVFPDYFLWF